MLHELFNKKNFLFIMLKEIFNTWRYDIFASMMRLLKISSFIVIAVLALNSCKPKAGTNAYLHMKTKPSQQERKANKRTVRRQEKMYNKQMLSNRKHLFGSKRDPHGAKKPGK